VLAHIVGQLAEKNVYALRLTRKTLEMMHHITKLTVAVYTIHPILMGRIEHLGSF